MNRNELAERVHALEPWIIETRRKLHRIPEKGFQEFKTQKLICGLLDEMGIPYTCERTWVIGEIEGAKPGPRVALRADIDALPITEPEGCEFRSEHEGWMHACGHDVHTAVLLGVAKLMSGLKDRMSGSLRLLFQPAEETVGGAEPMVAAGAVDGVDAVYGLHVQPYMPAGMIDIRPGTLNASTDEIEIIMHGKSGHAASPDKAVDAIVCMAHALVALQTAVSRSASPLKPAVLSFGAIKGGEVNNIICDWVRAFGTLRTADSEMRALMQRRIREISEGIAAAFGAEAEVNIRRGYAPLVNDAGEADRVTRVAQSILGAENVVLKPDPSMGGEDFSFFSEKVKGAFYHLGCSVPEKMPASGLHTPEFFVDERCLAVGVQIQSALAMDWLMKEE